MDGQIRLRWTSHQGTVLSMFDALLSTESMVDVTLACDGQYLRAHKVVLSACSPYFQELLSLDGSKNPFPIVFLKDVKYLELKALIQYMYRGEVNISQDELPSLLAVAQALKIRGLAEVESTKPNMSSDTLILPQSIPNVSNIHGSSPSIPATSVPSQPQSSSTIRPPPPSTYTSAPVTKRSRLHDTHHHVQSKSYPQPQDPFASIPTQPPPKTFYPPTTIPIEQEKIDYHRVTIVEESESIFGPEEEEVIKIEDGDNGLITADVDFELENRNENDDNSMSQPGFGESWNPGSEDGEENSAGAGSDLGVPGTSRSKTETEAQTGDRIGEGDEEEKLICHRCARVILRRSTYESHIRYDCPFIPARFECQICSYKGKRKQHLKYHLLKMHGIEKLIR